LADLFDMLRVILPCDAAGPQIPFHAGFVVQGQIPAEHQTVEAGDNSADLIPISRDKLVHGVSFLSRSLLSRTTTSYREIGNAFLVWLRLCCSAEQRHALSKGRAAHGAAPLCSLYSTDPLSENCENIKVSLCRSVLCRRQSRRFAPGGFWWWSTMKTARTKATSPSRRKRSRRRSSTSW